MNRRAGKTDNTLMQIMAAGSVAAALFALGSWFTGSDEGPPDLRTPDRVAATAAAQQGQAHVEGEASDARARAETRGETDQRRAADSPVAETQEAPGRTEAPRDLLVRGEGLRVPGPSPERGLGEQRPPITSEGMARRLSGEDVETDPQAEQRSKAEWERRLALEDDALVAQAQPLSPEQTRRMRAALSAFHQARRQLTADVQSGKIDRVAFRARARATHQTRREALRQILGAGYAKLDFDQAHFLAEKQANQ